MCPLCPRTPVHHVSGLYMVGRGRYRECGGHPTPPPEGRAPQGSPEGRHGRDALPGQLPYVRPARRAGPSGLPIFISRSSVPRLVPRIGRGWGIPPHPSAAHGDLPQADEPEWQALPLDSPYFLAPWFGFTFVGQEGQHRGVGFVGPRDAPTPHLFLFSTCYLAVAVEMIAQAGQLPNKLAS